MFVSAQDILYITNISVRFSILAIKAERKPYYHIPLGYQPWTCLKYIVLFIVSVKSLINIAVCYSICCINEIRTNSCLDSREYSSKDCFDHKDQISVFKKISTILISYLKPLIPFNATTMHFFVNGTTPILQQYNFE